MNSSENPYDSNNTQNRVKTDVSVTRNFNIRSRGIFVEMLAVAAKLVKRQLRSAPCSGGRWSHERFRKQSALLANCATMRAEIIDGHNAHVSVDWKEPAVFKSTVSTYLFWFRRKTTHSPTDQSNSSRSITDRYRSSRCTNRSNIQQNITTLERCR